MYRKIVIVLGHEGDPLGVDGTENAVFKESYQERFSSFLKSYLIDKSKKLPFEKSLDHLKAHDSRGLEPQVFCRA